MCVASLSLGTLGGGKSALGMEWSGVEGKARRSAERTGLIWVFGYVLSNTVTEKGSMWIVLLGSMVRLKPPEFVSAGR